MSVNGKLVWLIIFTSSAFLGRYAEAQDESLRQRIDRLERKIELLAAEVRSLKNEIQITHDQEGQSFEGQAVGNLAIKKDASGMEGVSFFGIRSWLVKVSSNNAESEISQYQVKLKKTRAEISYMNQQLEKALRHLREVSKQRLVFDLYQGEEVMKHVHPQATIDQAKMVVRQCEQQQRASQDRMARIQRRMAEARKVREIWGKTQKGQSVKLIARESVAKLAARMQSGQWYQVSGSSSHENGILYISVQSVAHHTDSP